MRPFPRPALWLVLAGLLLRLSAAAIYYQDPLSRGGDDAEYDEIAQNLASGRGFSQGDSPSTARAPLFPLALALVHKVSGSDAPGPVRSAQAVWSAFLLILVFRVAELAGGPLAGLAALAMAAFDPAQVLLPTSLYLECLYSGLVLLVAWAAALYAARPDDRRLAVLGSALGLSLTCRSTLALAAPGMLLRTRRKPLYIAACLLPLLPWTARNAVRFHRFIPFEDGVAGPVLYYASEGRLMAPEDEAGEEPLKTMYRTLPRQEWDRFSLRLAARNIAGDPIRYVSSSLARAWLFWTDSYTCYLLFYHPPFSRFMEAGRHWDLLRGACQAAFAAAVLLASYAAFRRRDSPSVRALAALALYFNVYAAGTVFARFNAPLTPLIHILAGTGLAALFERKRGTEG